MALLLKFVLKQQVTLEEFFEDTKESAISNGLKHQTPGKSKDYRWIQIDTLHVGLIALTDAAENNLYASRLKWKQVIQQTKFISAIEYDDAFYFAYISLQPERYYCNDLHLTLPSDTAEDLLAHQNTDEQRSMLSSMIANEILKEANALRVEPSFLQHLTPYITIKGVKIKAGKQLCLQVEITIPITLEGDWQIGEAKAFGKGRLHTSPIFKPLCGTKLS